jgi:hypothetical protein
VLALASAAIAQEPASSGLRGTVTDQAGGVMVGASVTLQSDAAQKRTTTTNGEGRYAFQDLPPGRYTLTVAYDGFLDSSASVDLRPRERATHDVRLEIGIAVLAEVRSTDQRKNLSTLVLTGKDISALPDDPQRFLQRILEMAGSTGRPNDVALLVDGFREYKRLPPKNTIEMIRINSNPFSAEFAQQGLDRIEITTKPGSDTFHGEFRFQGGDSALDARNPMAATKPTTRTRNYNGYLQGPIVKGRVDFIVYGGQWQQDENAIIHATVLDSAASQAQLLSVTAPTPTRINSAMAGTNFKVKNQRVNLTYTRNEETRRNQGLESGLDLPEHAFDRSTTEEIGRAWWPYVGSHFVNDLRVELRRGTDVSSARLDAPAVLVLDAFYAGGNQSAASRTSTTGTQVGETLTLQRGRHTTKAGLLLETTNQDSVDRSGFGGTFIFGTDVERDANGQAVLNEAGQSTPISPIENYRRTVLGLPGYAASEFSIVRGNPDVSVNQWALGWFLLDDWAISNRMSLSYGVRQDLQNNVKSRVTPEPRVALSWLLDEKGKNAIKVGAGMFTGRVDPKITLDTRKVDGIDRLQFIIGRPSGFPALPDTLDSASPVQSAIYTKAGDLQAPYSIISTVGYERQLPGGLFVLGQYTYNKGVDLLRLRNITAPVAGATGGTLVAPVLQFESTGRSLQQQLMLGLRGNMSSRLTLYANYIYGKKDSDTDDAYTTPADSHNLSIEYGPAADDQRHQFVAGTMFQFPHGLLITPAVTISSGRPFNITTGLDNNGDTIFSDRPAFAAPGDAGAIATRFGLLDLHPEPGDTIIPRNFGRERRQVAMNLSVSQTIAKSVIIAVDADNVLNNRNVIKSNGVLTSPTFGEPNQALNGRRLLLSVRYSF